MNYVKILKIQLPWEVTCHLKNVFKFSQFQYITKRHFKPMCLNLWRYFFFRNTLLPHWNQRWSDVFSPPAVRTLSAVEKIPEGVGEQTSHPTTCIYLCIVDLYIVVFVVIVLRLSDCLTVLFAQIRGCRLWPLRSHLLTFFLWFLWDGFNHNDVRAGKDEDFEPREKFILSRCTERSIFPAAGLAMTSRWSIVVAAVGSCRLWRSAVTGKNCSWAIGWSAGSSSSYPGSPPVVIRDYDYIQLRHRQYSQSQYSIQYDNKSEYW